MSSPSSQPDSTGNDRNVDEVPDNSNYLSSIARTANANDPQVGVIENSPSPASHPLVFSQVPTASLPSMGIQSLQPLLQSSNPPVINTYLGTTPNEHRLVNAHGHFAQSATPVGIIIVPLLSEIQTGQPLIVNPYHLPSTEGFEARTGNYMGQYAPLPALPSQTSDHRISSAPIVSIENVTRGFMPFSTSLPPAPDEDIIPAPSNSIIDPTQESMPHPTIPFPPSDSEFIPAPAELNDNTSRGSIQLPALHASIPDHDVLPAPTDFIGNAEGESVPFQPLPFATSEHDLFADSIDNAMSASLRLPSLSSPPPDHEITLAPTGSIEHAAHGDLQSTGFLSSPSYRDLVQDPTTLFGNDTLGSEPLPALNFPLCDDEIIPAPINSIGTAVPGSVPHSESFPVPSGHENTQALTNSTEHATRGSVPEAAVLFPPCDDEIIPSPSESKNNTTHNFLQPPVSLCPSPDNEILPAPARSIITAMAGSVSLPTIATPATDQKILPASSKPLTAEAPSDIPGKLFNADNKKRKAHSPNLKKLKMKKEGGFSSEDAMKLANAWVSQMSSGENLSESSMWNAIFDTCKIEHELAETPESLKCAWDNLCQDIRHFLSARTKVYAQRSPNVTDKEADELVQTLYRDFQGSAGQTGQGEVPPFIYIKVADYLSEEPKFMRAEFSDAQNRPNQCDEGTRGEDLKRVSAGDIGNDVRVGSSSKSVSSSPKDAITSSGSDAMLAMGEVENEKLDTKRNFRQAAVEIAKMADRSRPLGQKKTRELRRLQKEEKRHRENLESVEKSMARANQLFEESLSRDRDLALLQVLPKDSDEYKQVLKAVMNRRKLEDDPQKNKKIAPGKGAAKESSASQVDRP